MTVKELIEELKKYPDIPIYTTDGAGEPYEVDRDTIKEKENLRVWVGSANRGSWETMPKTIILF